MQQYFRHKDAYGDCLLFYRMGDFYELFFDDAVKAAGILDIALTKRGKHADQDIPMCGVPVHAAELYLQKLIASGLNVAICEQMETPEEAKKRGAKEVVRRDVVRIVTPGTVTEEALLAPGQALYLAALHYTPSPSGGGSGWGLAEARPSQAPHPASPRRGEEKSALAWLELSTGEFVTSETSLASLPALLARVAPRELLLTQGAYEKLHAEPWFAEWRTRATIRADALFDHRKGERVLRAHFCVDDLAAFGAFTGPELSAMGALMDYVQLTQMEAAARLDPPKKESPESHLQMDAATRRNLELTQTLSGERKGTLLSTLDRTLTAAGGRTLAAWLSAPLRRRDIIAARQDAVAYARADASWRTKIRDALAKVPDMERALGRLSLGRGGPRDLQMLGTGLAQSIALSDLLRAPALPSLLMEVRDALTGHHELADTLERALMNEVPLKAADGNFVASDWRADLAEYRTLRDESKRVLTLMEARLKKETDIGSLKIKHNNVLGYFIEITQIHEKKVPPTFIHRQGLAGSLRYSTPELNDIARKIEEAADRALKLELEVFGELVAQVLKQGGPIVATARALASLDALAALAERAEEGGWVRPQIAEDGGFAVEQGRHPVVEAALRRTHGEFIVNDCVMDEFLKTSPLRGEVGANAPGEGDSAGDNTPRRLTPTPTLPPQGGGRLWLLTGPNMGGKSTFLRQQAMLVILAQMGSCVPAKRAGIGLVDKLFCRVGAADDLARGQSTFMVEMVETASILNQATPASFVILDEIGRGTATYDGVSIAWAVAEHLHNVTQCRASSPRITTSSPSSRRRCRTSRTTRRRSRNTVDKLIFMHTIAPGKADKSYGIHVAALAGMPKPVLARSRALLKLLESGHSITEKPLREELPLFAHATPPAESKLAERLANVEPDKMTPMEGLQLVAELKKLAEE
ncbi:MAG: DNA mismatch repair protein MutS [Alphaproteobacteria bacterium]